jgi:feruloyl esterase
MFYKYQHIPSSMASRSLPTFRREAPRKMHLRPLFPLFGLLATALSIPSSSFQSKCAALASSIELDQPFTINVAQYLPANATIDYKAEGLNETCSDAVAYPIPIGVCRLNLRVETTERSEVYMEVWLPENWEGRLLTTGNGGLAGCTCSYLTHTCRVPC